MQASEIAPSVHDSRAAIQLGAGASVMEGLPDFEQLKTLVSVLAPGLIILTFREATRAGAKLELKERLLHYAAVSTVYYAAALPIFNYDAGLTLSIPLWAALQYLFVPAAIGMVAAYEVQQGWIVRIAALLGLKLAQPVPAAWDFAFSTLEGGTFLIVTLNDGQQIAGLLGSKSFVDTGRTERDLYLEEVYVVDHTGNWTKVTPPRSILLSGKEVRHVEIFG